MKIEVCTFRLWALNNFILRIIITDLLKDVNHKNATACVCPSQCMSKTYDLRISSADILINETSYVVDPFQWVQNIFNEASLNFFCFSFNLTESHMVVHVYFISQTYRVFIKSLLTNFISLIANLGGVYSLLIGMSILSLLEFFYFFSIRLYMNFKSLKYDEATPKTFKKRSEGFNMSTLKVPRLDTAKSVGSDTSSLRMSAMSHFWTNVLKAAMNSWCTGSLACRHKHLVPFFKYYAMNFLCFVFDIENHVSLLMQMSCFVCSRLIFVLLISAKTNNLNCIFRT